jgi:hypothetical protein
LPLAGLSTLSTGCSLLEDDKKKKDKDDDDDKKDKDDDDDKKDKDDDEDKKDKDEESDELPTMIQENTTPEGHKAYRECLKKKPSKWDDEWYSWPDDCEQYTVEMYGNFE